MRQSSHPAISVATAVLEHPAARPSRAADLTFCRCCLTWTCLLTVSLAFMVARFTSPFLKSSSDIPSSHWSVVTSLPWPLCLSCPALHLIKLPKCTSLLHSRPSSYSFGLQQNKLGEKAFSCLDLACIPKNFCKTNCSSTVVENFYWRVRKFYISNDRQNFKSQTKSHCKCFNFKSSCHFYCAEGVVSLCVVCYSFIKYIREPRKALYYFLPTQRSEPNKQIKRDWI